MKSKTFKLLISVILLVATLSPVVYAPYDTASPSESIDDAMMTTLGNYFGDTHYLALQDETVDMVTGIRFNGVGVPQGAKINNATLFVYNVYDHGVGIASCTLAGDDADNSMAFNDSSSFNRVYTLEYVIWDTSDIRSTGLHNVSITEIVQEIVDRPGWSSGNSLSLIMFSESGSPRREFASEDSFYTTPYIAIWYDEEPTPAEVEDIADTAPGPYNDTDVYKWKKNDTYRGIDIYIVEETGPPEIIVSTTNSLDFYNYSWGTDIKRTWATGSFYVQSAGVTENMAILGDWTFIIGHNLSTDDTRIYWSNDMFLTYNTSVRLNAQYPWLTAERSSMGAIWADQNGSNTLHVLWRSETPAEPTDYQILYTNFTLDPVTFNLTWAPTFFNVTEGNAACDDPDMYQEKDGTLHVVWQGRNGTANDIMQYRRRQANGTWLPAVRVSSDDVWDSFEGDVVANEDTGVALIVWTRVDAGDWDMKWDVVFPNNTVGTAVGSTDRQIGNRRYVSMVNDRSSNIAHVSAQRHSNEDIVYTYKLIDNSTAWSAADLVSSGGADRMSYNVIGLDEENSTLASVWHGGDGGPDTRWNYWQVETAPDPQDLVFLTGANGYLQYPHGMDYFSLSVLSTSIWLVYPNGTLVFPGPLPDGTDPEDAIDDLLGGAQPEDPETEEYGAIGKFQWKLLVMAVGFIMLLGSPVAGIHFGASAATWIKLLFIMCFGLAILSQLKFM